MLRISVCLATYNGEKYIREQLDSVLNQLGETDEVVVSDDNSTDSTLDIVRSYRDERIRIFVNNGPRGYSRNFENAILHAKNDILFLCDQDDVWTPDKKQVMLAALEEGYDLVVSDAEVVDAALNTIQASHFDVYGVKTGFWVNWAKTRYIGACMAFRRTVLLKALPFPENTRICAHDYWLTVVSEMYFSTALVSKPLLKYRRHGANASSGGLSSANSLGHKLRVRTYVLVQLLKRLF